MGPSFFNCGKCGEIGSDCDSMWCCACDTQICCICYNDREERLIELKVPDHDTKDFDDDANEFCCYGNPVEYHSSKCSDCCFKKGCLFCSKCEKRLKKKKEIKDGKPQPCKWCNAKIDIQKVMKKHGVHDSCCTPNINLQGVLRNFCIFDCDKKIEQWKKDNTPRKVRAKK